MTTEDLAGPPPPAPTETSASAGALGLAADYLCPSCAYNLRGLVVERCPECGEPFDPAKLSDTQIPWAHRRSIGRTRAYWKTVVWVMRRRGRLADELTHPLSYRDSQSFRWITILHCWLPFLLASLAGDWLDDVWLGVSFHVGCVLTLAVLTGVPSYFFHPRHLPVEQQNRAIVLSYYACAPLAWTPAALLLLWILGRGSFQWRGPGKGVETLAALAAVGLLMLGACGLWLQYLVGLARRGTQRTGAGLVFLGVGIPLCWIVAGSLTFVGTQALAMFLGLVYFSLQD